MKDKQLKELARQRIQQLMREIDANVRKLVEVFRFIFKYRLIVRSRSIEFAGLREYQNDDVSFIDWNSFAKTGKLYAKVYEEERDMDIVIVYDSSSSMLFGTQTVLKNEYASILAGTLAHSAIEVGDRVGLIMFNDRIVKFVPPARGSLQYYIILKELATPSNYGGGKNMERLLSGILDMVINPRTAFFFISDFLNIRDGWEDKMKLIGYRYERLFAMVVRDLRDEVLPEGAGLMSFRDPRTGRTITVDVDSIRDEFNRAMKSYNTYLEKTIMAANGHMIRTFTHEPFVKPLVKYLDLYG